MSPVALREAEADGVALPLPGLLERAQLERPVVALASSVWIVAQVSSVECPSTKISSVPLPITGVRASAAATLPASLRVGTITLTLARRGAGTPSRDRAARRSGRATRTASPGARTR